MSDIISRICGLLAAVALTCAMASCGKNEFAVSGQLKDAGNRSLTISYIALSDKQDELVTLNVPCNAGTFTLTCATRYPTIVWIMSADGRLLHPIYAERGDKIAITGDYATPMQWKVTGNDTSQRYSQWLAANEQILTAGNPRQVNAAVEKYVATHRDDAASALMILIDYHRNADETGFDRLWTSLTLSDDDKSRLLHVAMTELGNAETAAAALPLTPISLKNRADSMVTLNPSHSRATMLYFWRRTDGPHQGNLRMLASQPEDVQVADIFLDPDTVQWRYMTQNDTTARRTPLWAFGGEMNISLRRLAIPSDPFIIVADRKGRQLYRGTSPTEASAAAAKAK